MRSERCEGKSRVQKLLKRDGRYGKPNPHITEGQALSLLQAYEWNTKSDESGNIPRVNDLTNVNGLTIHKERLSD